MPESKYYNWDVCRVGTQDCIEVASELAEIEKAIRRRGIEGVIKAARRALSNEAYWKSCNLSEKLRGQLRAKLENFVDSVPEAAIPQAVLPEGLTRDTLPRAAGDLMEYAQRVLHDEAFWSSCGLSEDEERLFRRNLERELPKTTAQLLSQDS